MSRYQRTCSTTPALPPTSDPSNKKAPERKGKVQLIDGTNLCGKMRKSLGSKRNLMGEDDIKLITQTFGEFEVVDVTTLEELGLEKPPSKSLTVVASLLPPKPKRRKPLPAKSLTVPTLAIAA